MSRIRSLTLLILLSAWTCAHPTTMTADLEKVEELDWWQSGVFYQIYPRSFSDSNGDGVGDLPGITARLDYLKDLGVTGVWLSPIFTSPQADFGYDISSFRHIDPVYGTMADFAQLRDQVHARGLKLLLDLVPNHTSDEHEWFQKSVENDPLYADYYVWHDGRIENGTRVPPNNWLSYFEGPAWTWNERRQKYYLRQYHEKQPDLNYRNPAVLKEMLDVMKFWLDNGVDGFRVDSVNTLVEDEKFRDEPRSYLPGVRDTNHDYLEHIYTGDQPETYDIISKFRAFLEGYAQNEALAQSSGVDPEAIACNAKRDSCVALGVGVCDAHRENCIGRSVSACNAVRENCVAQTMSACNAEYPCMSTSAHEAPVKKPATKAMLTEAYTDIKKTVRYYGNSTHPGAHFAFNFFLITDLDQESQAKDLERVINGWMSTMPSEFWANWVLGNHDRPRIASRFGPESVDALHAVQFTLPGTAITFAGDEIGMQDTFVRWDETVDPFGLNVGKQHYLEVSRDGSRAPFLWDDTLSAGFSRNPRPWLPVNPNYYRTNLKSQMEADKSHFKVYRKLLQLKKKPVIQFGSLDVKATGKILTIQRSDSSRELIYVTVLNTGSFPEDLDLSKVLQPNLPRLTVYTSSSNSAYEEGTEISTEKIHLRPKEALVLTNENLALPMNIIED